jgi:outer membrane protein
MIKKFILVLMVFLTAFNIQAQRQKFGYVDTEYILEKMPEYRSAQRQLESFSESIQVEVDAKYDKLDKKFREYKAEEPLLTSEQRRQREEEIIKMEEDIKRFETEKFGPNGEIFRKREELIKPIQDKVFKAIQKISKENAYDFVFDISANMVVLITNPQYDLSDNVLEELGISIKD